MAITNFTNVIELFSTNTTNIVYLAPYVSLIHQLCSDHIYNSRTNRLEHSYVVRTGSPNLVTSHKLHQTPSNLIFLDDPSLKSPHQLPCFNYRGLIVNEHPSPPYGFVITLHHRRLEGTHQIQMSPSLQPLPLHKGFLGIRRTTHNVPQSDNLVQTPTTLKTHPSKLSIFLKFVGQSGCLFHSSVPDENFSQTGYGGKMGFNQVRCQGTRANHNQNLAVLSGEVFGSQARYA
ncbi:hypothetical protein V8G54_028407 [Vigna mungo]|uniref:Uncharacterized protein n=1 Tax=Vigna mungo TaxID=3915 RepID=A0AAQ3MSD1_VIGMU